MADDTPVKIPNPDATDGFMMPSSKDELNGAIDHAIRHKTLPAYLKTKDARKAFQSAFELIGGIPRLALWAHQNPDKFFPLYARFLDIPAGGNSQPQIHLHLSWMKGRDLTGASNEITDVESDDVQP
jgi:hypothetical protein